MSKGYVYAAREPGAREVKIGKTRKSPEVRLRQLNNTSVVKDLEYEFLLAVSKPDEVEKAAHAMLASCRVRKDREFFRCSPRRAQSVIKRAAGRAGGCYSIASTSGTVMGTGRRVLQLLLGTSMAITGSVMSAVLLFVLFVDPVARGAYAEWMLGLIAVSGLILWCGVKLMRRRVLPAYR